MMTQSIMVMAHGFVSQTQIEILENVIIVYTAAVLFLTHKLIDAEIVEWHVIGTSLTLFQE